MTYDPNSPTASPPPYGRDDDSEKYVLATIPTEESGGLLPSLLLLSLLLLIGLLGLFWLSFTGQALPARPTATPTATLRPATPTPVVVANTPTPDLRATEVIALLATRAEADRQDGKPDLAVIVAELIADGPIRSDRILTPAPTSTPFPQDIASNSNPNAVETQQPPEKEEQTDSEIFFPAAPRPGETDVPPTDTPTVTPLPSTEVDDTIEITDGTEVAASEAITSPNTVTNTTDVTISMPIAYQPDDVVPTPTDDATPEEEPTAEPTEVPTAEPTNTPTATTVVITATNTVTPTLAPTNTPTETPTPSPTPTQFFASSIKGKVVDIGANISLYKEPSRRSGTNGFVTPNKEITILNRGVSGEWLFVCCNDSGGSGWIRQVDAPPTGNELADVIGQEQADIATQTPEADRPNANDIKWVEIRDRSGVVPRGPSIPTSHFSLYRYTPDNQAKVELPKLTPNGNTAAAPSLNEVWSPNQRVNSGVLSYIAVTDKAAYATGGDGHIYSLKLQNGEQEAIYKLEGTAAQISNPFIILDQVIYGATDGGLFVAVNEQPLEAKWTRQLATKSDNRGLTPVTGINALDNMLYFGAKADESSHYIVGINRDDNGSVTFTEPLDMNNLVYPAIGNQLVYFGGGNRVVAADAHDGKTIWTKDLSTGSVSAPLVYSKDGITALTELYAAAGEKIFILDANTGVEQEFAISANDPVSGMALDANTLYASAGNWIQAFNRDNGSKRWETRFDLPLIGGPLIDDTHLMAVTENGIIHYLDIANGNMLFNDANLGGNASHVPSVSGSYIFVPGTAGQIFVWQGQ